MRSAALLNRSRRQTLARMVKATPPASHVGLGGERGVVHAYALVFCCVQQGIPFFEAASHCPELLLGSGFALRCNSPAPQPLVKGAHVRGAVRAPPAAET